MSIEIKITKTAQKEILKAPKEIQEKVSSWVDSVLTIGLDATRKQGGNGLHDEPLKGNLAGMRSIRLNKAWRLIYTVEKGKVSVLVILSLTPHKY